MSKDGFVWSEYCIDESKGFDFVDCNTGIKYEVCELNGLSKDVKSRIVMKPRKIGRWVKKNG